MRQEKLGNAGEVGVILRGVGRRQYKSAANSTRIISCFTTRDTTEMMMEMTTMIILFCHR